MCFVIGRTIMDRDKELEKDFIRTLATKCRDRDFIISSLTLMDEDEMRKKVIQYIHDNPQATVSDIKVNMAFINVGMQ